MLVGVMVRPESRGDRGQGMGRIEGMIHEDDHSWGRENGYGLSESGSWAEGMRVMLVIEGNLNQPYPDW
jgi:hypothetical protein